jgi:hypothetical protein
MRKRDEKFMWYCASCNEGNSGLDLRTCEQEQIRHARRRHRRESGYTVKSQGRVIYRVP